MADVQPIIADVNQDGTADAPGFWKTSQFLDMPTQFSRNDTVGLTNPADWFEFVMKDYGLAAGDLNAAEIAAAKAIYAGWGLTFNGAYWYHQTREKVLADLLTMCHSTLTFGATIGIKVLTKTPVKTITTADVLRINEIGPGTFGYQAKTTRKQADCGHVTWQPAGEAQDRFLRILVPVKAARTKIGADDIEVPFVQNSQNVQRIGTLYYHGSTRPRERPASWAREPFWR